MSSIPITYYAISGLINFAAAFVIAFVVYLRNPRAIDNRTFSIFSFLVAWWSFFYFLWLIANNRLLAEFYMRTCMLAVFFMPPVFLHFVASFTKTELKFRFLVVNYLVSTLFLFTTYSPLYARGVSSYLNFPYWLIPGPVFHLAIIHFFIVVLYAFYLLVQRFRKSKGIYKVQIRYILVGTAIGYISGSTNYFAWYRIAIPPVFNIFVSLYVGFIAYAIVKHRLMDIRLLVIRSLTYTFTLGLILTGYVTLAIFVFQKLKSYIDPISLNAITLFTLVFTFQPLKTFIEASTNRLFSKGRYVFNEFLGEINEITKKNSRSINALTREIMKTLIQQMHVSKAAFVLASSGNFSQVRAMGFDEKNKSLWREPVALVLKANKTLAYDELEEESKEKDILRKSQAEVLIPVKTEEKTEAILALGEKKSGDMYSAQDLKLLELIAPQIALTLENARLYEQAITDALTGLYHHKYFQVRLCSEFERARRHKHPLSLIMLDLDFFKDINDEWGHRIGNEVLIELTGLIKDNVRGYDIVGRYGGDEFVILLPVVSKKEVRGHQALVKQIANRIRKVIEKHPFTDKRFKVEASLGVAIYNGKADISPDELLEKADKLLYKAKNNGRNTICIEVLKSKRAA